MTRLSEAETLDALYSLPGMVARIRAEHKQRDPAAVARADSVAAIVEGHLLNSFGRQPDVLGAGKVKWQAIPAWVRLQILDVALRWSRGEISTCRHSPNPEHPDPVIVGLWRPDLVTCAVCAPALLRLTGEPDRTCDSCGRVTDGPESADGIYAYAVTHGPMMCWWGACRDCRTPPPGRGGVGTSRKRKTRPARRPRRS